MMNIKGTKNIKCNICGSEFVPSIDKHYIARDNGKTGVSEAFSHNEEKLYDTFDCPVCGCQVIVQERKRIDSWQKIGTLARDKENGEDDLK